MVRELDAAAGALRRRSETGRALYTICVGVGVCIDIYQDR